MQPNDMQARELSNYIVPSDAPIRLGAVSFANGSSQECSGTFSDDSWLGRPTDRQIYLVPRKYMSVGGIQGPFVVMVFRDFVQCVMPWRHVTYIDLYPAGAGWNGEIPECLRKLAEQAEKPIQSQKSKDADDRKSGENENAKVSVWWWNPNTGVKCWVNVSGGHHTPTRPASGKERHCVIVDGVEYYR